MTFVHASTERRSRSRWLEIAAAVWLLLISALALITCVGLARHDDPATDNTTDTRIETLSQRVRDLEQQADAHKRSPAPISQSEFATARQTLEERITHLEESQPAGTLAADLQTLQTRVVGMENRLGKAQPPIASVRPHAPAAPRPNVPEPPFRVLGVEMRGGERFLSIAAATATSLANTRLLREGDVDSRWQLQSIESKAAVFQIDGQTRRIVVP